MNTSLRLGATYAYPTRPREQYMDKRKYEGNKGVE
jgi:hypothetical protein